MLVQLDMTLLSSRSFAKAIEQNFDPEGYFYSRKSGEIFPIKYCDNSFSLSFSNSINCMIIRVYFICFSVSELTCGVTHHGDERASNAKTVFLCLIYYKICLCSEMSIFSIFTHRPVRYRYKTYTEWYFLFWYKKTFYGILRCRYGCTVRY